jgi:hypothetical protein
MTQHNYTQHNGSQHNGLMCDTAPHGASMTVSRECWRGKCHCTIDLLFYWFALVCFAYKNKNSELSNHSFQTSKTGGQQYSDTSPFSIPCSKHNHMRVIMLSVIFPSVALLSISLSITLVLIAVMLNVIMLRTPDRSEICGLSRQFSKPVMPVRETGLSLGSFRKVVGSYMLNNEWWISLKMIDVAWAEISLFLTR